MEPSDLLAHGDITTSVTNSHLGSSGAIQADSLWLRSYFGSGTLNVDRFVLSGRLDVDVANNATVNVSNSKVDQSVRVIAEGKNTQTNVAIKNSTITVTNTSNMHGSAVHGESGSGGTTIEIDGSTIGLTADSSPSVSQDVKAFADNGGQAQVIVNDSTVQNGVIAYAIGSDTKSRSMTQIGTEETAGNVATCYSRNHPEALSDREMHPFLSIIAT